MLLNLSQAGIGNATATLYYYKDGVYNDVAMGNPVVVNGQVSFA
ncbi:MAG: hypothetical protein ACM3X6_14025 [Patescibacteria group bacterium]